MSMYLHNAPIPQLKDTLGMIGRRLSAEANGCITKSHVEQLSLELRAVRMTSLFLPRQLVIM